MSHTNDIILLIPAYNPSGRLYELIGEFRKINSATPIIIVNDGSKKESDDTFSRLKEYYKIEVISNAINLGKGAALKVGINHALIQNTDIVSIVTADADGQHSPEDIQRVIEESRNNPTNLVLGYRTFDNDIPFRSKFGNNISKIVYRYLLGLKLKDTQTGLRGIPKKLAYDTLKIKANKYELETEQLALTARNNIPVHQIPIKTIYEDNNSSSHFNPFYDSIRIYYALIRYTFSSLLTALTDIIAFIGLSSFIESILWCNLGSRYIALFLQFFLLKNFVFKSSGGFIKLILFIGYVSFTGVVSALLQTELTSFTGIGIIASKLIVDTALFLFNFLFLRDVLFRKPDYE